MKQKTGQLTIANTVTKQSRPSTRTIYAVGSATRELHCLIWGFHLLAEIPKCTLKPQRRCVNLRFQELFFFFFSRKPPVDRNVALNRHVIDSFDMPYLSYLSKRRTLRARIRRPILR